MSRRPTSLARGAAALALATAFAACAEPLQPVAASLDAAGSMLTLAEDAVALDTDRHIVVARGSAFSKDLLPQIARLGGTVEFLHKGVGFAVVSGLSAEAVQTLAARSDVGEIQPDATFSIHTPMTALLDDEVTPADAIASVANPATASRYSWQWNMRAIDAQAAWAAGQLGEAGVTVAILDTGLDYDNPDLNGLVDMSRSASFIPWDDTNLTNVYFPTRHVMNDYHGHGTNVGAQVSSKAVVHAGVTSKTTLLGVKVLSARGSGSLSAVLSGVLHSADVGADVANMSLGGGFAKAANGRYVRLVQRVFNYAKQQGMVVVVAAGNDAEDLDANGNTLKTYCDAVHVVCVSSVGPQTASGNPHTSSLFTNYGTAIDIAGPGGNYLESRASTQWIWGAGAGSWVWSYCAKHRLAFSEQGALLGYAGCQTGNRVTGMVGTSQAAPHVAGVAALLVAKIGKDRPAQVKEALLQSMDGVAVESLDPRYGAGVVNVARALGL